MKPQNPVITRSLRILLGLATAQVLAACGGEGLGVLPAPTGQGAGGAQADASAPDGGGGTGGAAGSAGSAGAGGFAGAGGSAGAGGATPLRTIIVRDPFANLDVPDNLLLDGGFEFSGDMSSPWGAARSDRMEFGNGFKCRSGVRCGVVTEDGIFGFFVSPGTGKLAVTLHVRPTQGACSNLDVYALDIYSQQTNPQQVVMEPAAVGDDGWCELVGAMNAMPHSVPALFMMAKTEPVIVDDIVVRAANATTGLRSMSAPAVPSTAMRNRLTGVAADARAQLWHERKRPRPQQGAPWTARFHAWMR